MAFQPQPIPGAGSLNGIPGIRGGSSLFDSAVIPYDVPSGNYGGGVYEGGGNDGRDPAESSGGGGFSGSINYGSTIGGLFGGPLGAQIGGFAQGYGTGVTNPSSNFGHNVGANMYGGNMSFGNAVSSQLAHATSGFSKVGATETLDENGQPVTSNTGILGSMQTQPAANPMQKDPATMAGQTYGGGSSAGNLGDRDSGATGGSNAGDPGSVDGRYAQGGLVNMGGQNGYVEPQIQAQPQSQGPGLQTPGAAPPAANPQMIESKINNLLQSNPQQTQQLQMHIQQAIQSGEVTPEQIQQLGQIAQVCLRNPAMYPQLVKVAESRGIVQPGELPPTYNEGVVTLILIASRAAGQSSLGQPGTPGQEGGAPIQQGQQMSHGGVIRGPGTGTSDSIKTTNKDTGEKVAVSNGEYIIPAHVVQVKGKEFFDNLLRKYSEVSGERKEA